MWVSGRQKTVASERQKRLFRIQESRICVFGIQGVQSSDLTRAGSRIPVRASSHTSRPACWSTPWPPLATLGHPRTAWRLNSRRVSVLGAAWRAGGRRGLRQACDGLLTGQGTRCGARHAALCCGPCMDPWCPCCAQDVPESGLIRGLACHWTGQRRAECLNRAPWRRTISVGSVLVPPIRYKTRRNTTLGPRALLAPCAALVSGQCKPTSQRAVPEWHDTLMPSRFSCKTLSTCSIRLVLQPTASDLLLEVDA